MIPKERNIQQEKSRNGASPTGEDLISLELLMDAFAELEYQFFLEKNEMLNAASKQPRLDLSHTTNQKTAA
jgi:hypothetical protein